jgi:hypothetical protein
MIDSEGPVINKNNLIKPSRAKKAYIEIVSILIAFFIRT